MTPALWLFAFSLSAFLLGSIPFGWLFARAKGIDLQKVGSGNIGATNAARALGRPIGVLVLVLDAGKAYLPTVLMREHIDFFPALWPVPWLPGLAPALIGFCAIVGHVFSPWLKFKGGKGVASMLGVFIALSPVAAAIFGVTWVACYALFKISSVGSLVATLALVLAMVFRKEPAGYLVAVVATFVLVVARHTDNIRRLFARAEERI